MRQHNLLGTNSGRKKKKKKKGPRPFERPMLGISLVSGAATACASRCALPRGVRPLEGDVRLRSVLIYDYPRNQCGESPPLALFYLFSASPALEQPPLTPCQTIASTVSKLAPGFFCVFAHLARAAPRAVYTTLSERIARTPTECSRRFAVADCAASDCPQYALKTT